MNKEAETDSKNLDKAAAWKFIILVGVVSLFSDMTYEGAPVSPAPFWAASMPAPLSSASWPVWESSSAMP